MQTLTVQEFQERMKAQGVTRREDVAFKCPMCKTVQSLADWLDAGIPAEEAEGKVGFSCIGRASKEPQRAFEKPKPGRGCDYTLGGLIVLNDVEIITEDGRTVPAFELATPEEAQGHAAARG